MVVVVTKLSITVIGSMSRGTRDVTIPAPQKKACMYFISNDASYLSQNGGCHLFSCAYHGEMNHGSVHAHTQATYSHAPDGQRVWQGHPHRASG